MSRDPDPDLGGAYALQTPADHRRYYAGWAARYDADFAAPMAYRLPDLVAGAYAAAGGAGPVLDVGAGTGLLGLALAARGIGPVDGVDLSPEMLTEAAAKGCYRSLVQADLTAGPPPVAAPYAGLASSGTFTLGHLGPAVLTALFPLCASGAVVALSVHERVWEAGGFAAALRPGGRIAASTAQAEPIYATAAKGDPHADDRALIVTLRLS
jgi:predicted TPR repeat methyltransferase